MSGRSADSVFGPHIATAIAVIGAVLLIVILLLVAFGADLDRRLGSKPGPAATVATGYVALSELTRRLAPDAVGLARNRSDLDRNALLVLTPDPATPPADLAAIIERRAARQLPVLMILPKWLTLPQPGPVARVRKISILPSDAVAPLAAAFGGGLRREGNATAGPLPPYPALRFRRPLILQTLRSERLRPLIATASGGIVLGRRPDAPLFVLTDPDLVANHGLADRVNARAAIAMLSLLATEGDGTILFDTTLHGATDGNRNLLRLMFTPPFLAATLALIVAALFAALANIARFGPIRREPPADGFGKGPLIDNIAMLTRAAGRTLEVGRHYAPIVRERAARRLNLPPGLDETMIDRALDRAAPANSRPIAELTRRVADARSEAELLVAAQALHDWSREKKE